MEAVRDLFAISGSEVVAVLIASALIVVAVITVVRVNGLRSFSKMSGFDFAVTVAIGSLIAGVANLSVPVTIGALAVVVLIAVQRLVARLRRSTEIEKVVDNEPLLLMHDGEILSRNLSKTRVTEHDLFAKLREANVTHLDQVRAVVMETTGDVSVLHGDTLDGRVLRGVRTD